MLRIYRARPDIPPPGPASRDLKGDVPARALKYCEPFLVANAAGVLVNSPIDMTLTWTGHEVLAELEGVEETLLVERLFLPDFADHWEAQAPPDARPVMPPFLEAFPERGVVQVWSGLFVRTPPGVATWVRGPVNRNRGSAASVTEGVVDTDWWTGPLFFVLQFERTDFPVSFRRDEPMIQIVPVDRSLMQSAGEGLPAVELAEAPAEFWSGLVDTAARRNGETPGSYRREARRRGREVAA